MSGFAGVTLMRASDLANAMGEHNEYELSAAMQTAFLVIRNNPVIPVLWAARTCPVSLQEIVKGLTIRTLHWFFAVMDRAAARDILARNSWFGSLKADLQADIVRLGHVRRARNSGI